MILHCQRNQISQRVRTICTSYVHNFPLNFHNLVCSLIFYRIFTNLYIQRVRIFLQILTIYTLNVQNFPLNFHDFVSSMKTNLSTIRSICTSYVHNFPLIFHNLVNSLIFHRIFMNLYIQRIRIFLLIRSICKSNVQNFAMNFDFVFSTNLNF